MNQTMIAELERQLTQAYLVAGYAAGTERYAERKARAVELRKRIYAARQAGATEGGQ